MDGANEDDDGVVFRVLSDLHLEMYGSAAALLATVPFEPDRDARSFLLLAGDVGYPMPGADGDAYYTLLDALAARFRGVFVIAGNHEYYECAQRRAQMADVDAAARAVCAALHRPSRPVVFLQKDEWTICVERAGRPAHVTRVLGCTLWTPVTAADARRMNDAACMGVAAPWIRAVHAEHAAWLRGRLSASEAAEAAASSAAKRAAAAEDEEEEDVRVVDMEDDGGGADDRGTAAALPESRVTVVRLDGSVSAGAAELARLPVQRRVVLTHHLPSCFPAAADLDRPLSGYYADMFRPSRGWPADAYPDLWVGGHDHAQARGWLTPGCALVTCCHGYPESAMGNNNNNNNNDGRGVNRTKAQFATVMRRLQPPAARQVVGGGQQRRAVYTDALVELLPPSPPTNEEGGSMKK